MGNWYVYRHIRLDKNEPFYIGIGSTKDYKRAYSKISRNKIWKSIIDKTDYEVEILFDNLTKEEAIKKEVEFIKIYGRKNDGRILSNQTNGGEGIFGRENIEEWKINLKKAIANRSNERKKEINALISKKLKGHVGYMKGKKLTEEAKQKISAKRKGIKLSDETKQKLREINTGKKMSEETKQKIRDWSKNVGFTNEQRKKMSEAASFERSEETKKKMSQSAKIKKIKK